jgi:acyl-CoA thioesterase FadM
MNLWFRLIVTVLFGRWRLFAKPYADPLKPCSSVFRVYPSDLDAFMHMNNAKYLAIMDVARFDLMVRSRLFDKLNAQRWYPVILAETASFHRSLKLFQKFEIVSHIIHWDDKDFYMTQDFIHGGRPVANAVVKCRFLSRDAGSVPIAELKRVAAISTESPELPLWIRQWSDAHELQKQSFANTVNSQNGNNANFKVERTK